MATFTERLAILIDAKTGGAVRDMQAVANAADSIDAPVGRADKVVQSLGLSSMLTGSQLKAGVAAGAAAAGFAFAAFAKNGIEAASALREQVSASGRIFGDAAGQVRGFAQDADTGFKISERAALQAANAFGDLFTKLGASPDQAAKLSTTLVALAGDLASFKDLAVDDALGKLQSGLAGETEPLRDFGVFLTEARVQAEAVRLGLADAHGEVSEGAKVFARYSLILNDTKSAQGDAARTGDDFAGQQRELTAQTENLSAAIGEVLIPSMLKLTDAANAVIDPLQAALEAPDKLKIAGVSVREIAQAFDVFSLKTEDAEKAARASTDAYDGTNEVLAELKVRAEISKRAIEEHARAQREAAQAADDYQSAFRGVLDAQESYDDALEGVSDAERDVERAVRDLAEAREAEAESTVEAAEAVERANEAVARSYRNLQNAQESQRRSAFQLQEQGEETAAAQRDYDQALADFGPNHHLTVEALERLTDSQQELSERQYDAEEAARRVTDAENDLAQAHEDARQAQDELTEAHHRGSEASERVRDASEALSDAQEALRDAQDRAADAAIDLNDSLDKQREALIAAGDGGAFLGDKLREIAELYPAVAPQLLGIAALADGITASFRNAQQAIDDTVNALIKAPGLTDDARGVRQILGPTLSPNVTNHITVNTQATDPDEVARIIAWTLGGQ